MSKPLRIGVLGAANIARSFTSGVRPSSRVEVAAVASRDLAKAQAFAAECGIARALGSYESLLADPAIDAIYNPLPNSLHAEWSIKALEAGKHVLCEKPLAMSADEVRAMVAAAHRTGRLLVEAYPYRAQAQTRRMQELIEAGAIGQVEIIRASFGVTFANPANIRLKPELGGGSIYDIGSYPLSLVRLITGTRATHVSAVATWTETGVDRSVLASLEFPGGVLAQISSSFATSYHRQALIAGSAGTIETTYLNHPPVGGAPVLTLRRGILVSDPVETIPVAPGNGFLLEAESFEAAVRGGPGQWTGATQDESLDIAMMLDAILLSMRGGGRVAVG